jgi:glutathione synthase/RimK-type ligase-like ATP-grasp enzyme
LTVKMYTHNPHSEGGRALAGALGIRRIKHEGSRWRPRVGDRVINWGSSRLPDFQGAHPEVLNPPRSVSRVSNKLHFFTDMSSSTEDPRVPGWATTRQEAREWFANDHKVVCRTLLTSHSGRGIIIAESENDLVDTPLYTRYVKKQAEYRVHIVRGRVIDIQRKIRDPDRTPTDWQVRSHANGFIFVRENVQLPEDARTQALRAFNASGLDFGAVDVIVESRTGLAYVLEINTAPGLTGTTVTNYANAFREEFF